MLRMFENGVLSKMLGSEREEVTADLRRLHSVELYDLYSLQNKSGDQFKKNKLGRECSNYWRQKKAAYSVLVGKHEGKIPLGRPRRRWEDYYKMVLQEVELRRGLDWYGSGFGQVGVL